MVIDHRVWLAAVASLGITVSVSCKVLVEDNCANQSVPGNDYCRELYSSAAPYCSPCRRELHGCVAAPAFSCPGYYNEIGDDEPDPDDGTTTDEPATTEAATTTGDVEAMTTGDTGGTSSGGDTAG